MIALTCIPQSGVQRQAILPGELAGRRSMSAKQRGSSSTWSSVGTSIRTTADAIIGSDCRRPADADTQLRSGGTITSCLRATPSRNRFHYISARYDARGGAGPIEQESTDGRSGLYDVVRDPDPTACTARVVRWRDAPPALVRRRSVRYPLRQRGEPLVPRGR